MADAPNAVPTPQPSDGGSGLPVAPTPQPTAQPTAQPSDGGSGLPVAGANQSTPSGPATAPAGTLPPSTSSGLHGVLANIAMGALAGAAAGIRKVAAAPKRVYGSYINATPYGQKVQAGKIELQQDQQKLEESKQKAADTHTEALDTHQEAVLRMNGVSMDQIHKAVENAHLENLYPLQEEADKVTLMGQLRTQNEADRDMMSTLASMGIKINTDHGAGLDNLTQDHAKAIANGTQVAISNGEVGDKAGLGFIDNSQLEQTVIPTDVNVASDYKLDDKGNITPIYTTLKGGQNTAMDALIAHDAGMKKFSMLQAMYQDKLKNQSTQAVSAKDLAEATAQKASAALNEAYAKQIGGGAGTTPTAEVGAAVAALPVNVQKNLQQFDPGIQGLLIRGAGGWIDPNTFPQRLTKGGIGITRSTASAMMTEINPKWTDALYGTIKKVNDAFVDGKEGQAVRSFNQFLVHSATVQDVSNEFQRTNSPWLNKPLNVLRAQGMGDPEVAKLMTAIEAQRGEWQTFIDNGYKPDAEQSQRAAILESDTSSPAQIAGVSGIMGDQAVGRLDQLNESYRTATGIDYPNLITPTGRDAATKLGLGGLISKYKTGGSYNAGRNAPTQPEAPPPGATGRAPDPKTGIVWWHDIQGRAISKYTGQ